MQSFDYFIAARKGYQKDAMSQDNDFGDGKRQKLSSFGISYSAIGDRRSVVGGR
jgi:hypothetical protein